MTFAFMVVLGLIVLIPVLAIVIDSPLSEALARRIGNGDSGTNQSARIDALEQEVQYLTQTVEGIREETAFVRALVEGDEALPALPGGEARRPAGNNGER
ncbi:hypothetical protein [Candidatus Palauibacter sp.]|uniref:hypothetical protein n=1 Tax=Candidatus Palauibacter sp. TaxID=3101350 RepID=UPI003B02041A